MQENDDKHRGHQLYGNLAPEELDPEDAYKAKAESPQEERHGHEKDIPLTFLVCCVLQKLPVTSVKLLLVPLRVSAGPKDAHYDWQEQ